MKRKFQLSSFVATLMPFYVSIVFAIFSLPGGLRDAWIGKEKVDLLSLGLIALAVGVPAIKDPTQYRSYLFVPMNVCRN